MCDQNNNIYLFVAVLVQSCAVELKFTSLREMVQLTLFGKPSPPVPSTLAKRSSDTRAVVHVPEKRSKRGAASAPVVDELGAVSSLASASAPVPLGAGSSSGGTDGTELAVRSSTGGTDGKELGSGTEVEELDDGMHVDAAEELGSGTEVKELGSGTEVEQSVGRELQGSATPAFEGEAGEIMFENPNCQLPRFGQPFCTKCGYVVDPIMKGVRLTCKSPPAFQCSKCNCKSTMLHRMFGSWPMQEFRELAIEEQQAFWRTSTSSMEGLRRSVEQHLLTRLVEALRRTPGPGPLLSGENPQHEQRKEA
jgi:hypothetical protein